MSSANTTRGWGALSKALHWLIVLLIINQWLDRTARRFNCRSGWRSYRAVVAKSFGITILMLGERAPRVALDESWCRRRGARETLGAPPSPICRTVFVVWT